MVLKHNYIEEFWYLLFMVLKHNLNQFLVVAVHGAETQYMGISGGLPSNEAKE